MTRFKLIQERRMPTILVIDDDIQVRGAIEAVLTSTRCGVFVAPNGVTGLALFRQVKFDAVIVDIFMPEMDGLGTIREMRARDPRIPVVAISGHPVTGGFGGAPDFLAMSVELGATRALHKPFTRPQLFEALRACFDLRNLPFPALPAPDRDDGDGELFPMTQAHGARRDFANAVGRMRRDPYRAQQRHPSQDRQSSAVSI